MKNPVTGIYALVSSSESPVPSCESSVPSCELFSINEETCWAIQLQDSNSHEAIGKSGKSPSPKETNFCFGTIEQTVTNNESSKDVGTRDETHKSSYIVENNLEPVTKKYKPSDIDEDNVETSTESTVSDQSSSLESEYDINETDESQDINEKIYQCAICKADMPWLRIGQSFLLLFLLIE